MLVKQMNNKQKLEYAKKIIKEQLKLTHIGNIKKALNILDDINID